MYILIHAFRIFQYQLVKRDSFTFTSNEDGSGHFEIKMAGFMSLVLISFRKRSFVMKKIRWNLLFAGEFVLDCFMSSQL